MEKCFSGGYGKFYYKKGNIKYEGNGKMIFKMEKEISYDLFGNINHKGYFKESVPKI